MAFKFRKRASIFFRIGTFRSLRRLAGCGILFLAASSARAATITVNSTADGSPANDGVCTLREAIIAANTNVASGAMAGECAAGVAGLDTIAFAIPGAGVHTIVLVGGLPTITEAVFINGYSQPGSSANTNVLNAGINAVITIFLDTSSAGPLRVNAANSVIRGLAIRGGGDGITIAASNVTIAGNFVGTSPAGNFGFGPSAAGVRVQSGNNVVIGGALAADRNLVSGYRGGSIEIEGGTGTLVQGNYIGPDITGTVSLQDLSATPFGVQCDPLSSSVTVVGNLISGNANGVVGYGGGLIQGNLIGTQRDGVTALPNSVGVYLLLNPFVVGGTGPGQSNTIAYSQEGVRVQPGVSGCSILGNSIFSSARMGINLSGIAGITPLANDACDVDTLPGNQGQNYPVITSAPIASGNVTISGTLNSTASTTFRVEFFSNVVCGVSGNGEGRTFLGFANVTTNPSCNASFGPLVFAVPPGQVVFTATATDPANNTSEFAACFPIGAPPTPTPTVTPTSTVTATPTSTPVGPTPTPTTTPTPVPAGGAAAVPTLAPNVLAFLGLALALVALFVLRKSS